MLGIMLDNAGKWAHEHIVCRLRLDNGRSGKLLIEIEDDGPGVDPCELLQLGQRGIRLDESIPGHGLGLAILKQLVEHYAGNLAFLSSDSGGLRVHIELPL